MRKVVLTSSDFEMFDTDINSVEFEFFQKHKEAFKRMWIEQGKKFWIQFVITFRQFAVDYGAIKEFPAKSEQFEDFVDQAFIIIHNNFVDGKFGTARNLIMDIVMVAQNRHTLQYLESKSYAKDPFYNKETRDVFRRLFGAPSEKASYIKVYVLLPLYMKYGGAVCVCLRRWLDADDFVEDSYDSNSSVTNISSYNDKKTNTNTCEKSNENPSSFEPKKKNGNTKSSNNCDVKENIEEKKVSNNSEKKETCAKGGASGTLDLIDKSKNKKDVNGKNDDIVNGSDNPGSEKSKETENKEKNENKSNSRKKPQIETPENGMHAFKQLEVLSKDLVQSMNGHPFIKSSTIKVKLESGTGQEEQSSTFHSDGRVEHNASSPEMDEAEAKFNSMMKMREEPIIHSDEFFKMYIDEVTKGSVLSPVHVPGWPRNVDPRFFDSDNPLYDPESKKDEWKSNLKLGDFQEFVRYVLRNYKNGKKNQMVTIQTQYNLKDSPFSRVKPEIPISPEEIERKKDQEKVAKDEEEKRKKLEEERKRQKKIRKKLKKGLPLYKDPPSNVPSNKPKQDVGIVIYKGKDHIPDPRKPYIMESKSKEEPDSPIGHESRFFDKNAERERMENEPNSVKLTKKVDEKAGVVSVTIEKRDQKGRLTKETTVKPLSEDGSIWEEAMKKINPAPTPPVLNDTVQKQLAEKLSKNNFFEDSASENDTSDSINNTSMCLQQGEEMPEEDRRQFREMYKEISAAIADVSRQNQAEEDGKCTHFMCSHDTRHEKARNRLRRKIGERKQDRRHPDLPGLLRLTGSVEYPANEREAMMITLAEMTKMSPRERELFQERLGRTKYFKDCQEDPRDVADSMGAFLFPGMKKTLTDQKSQQKKEKVRAMEAKEEKEKQHKKSQTVLEESLNKFSDKEDIHDNVELCMADVEKVISYKDDVKRMKEDLHYNHIKLNHMIEKQKKDKEFVRTGREFDEQVRKASEDLRVLEQKIALLDKECAGSDNPEFNANVMKAAEELRAVKKKVEKWEADADVLSEKLDKFEKEGDLNALLDGEDIDSVDDADKDTHGDKDELDYELPKRKGPIDQEKVFEDFKEVMGLKNFPFEDDRKDKSGKNIVNKKSDNNENNTKSSIKGEKKKTVSSKNEAKTKDKKKSKQSDDIVLEINERIAEDFQCNIPNCIGCKALKKYPAGYPGGPPADLDGHGDSCSGENEKDATQKFIEDLDSGALPPPPPGVSITVLQRVTEPVNIKPNCAINMGSNNPNSKEFKSYWRAAKHYGPTPPNKMLDDPQHLNLINITNTGTSEDPKIQKTDFGAIPKLSRDQSPIRKRREKIQVKIARDKPPKREKTPSLTIEDVTELLREEEAKSAAKKESVEKTKTIEGTAPVADEKSSKASEKSRQLKACSGCDKSEPYSKAFKKCQKCKVLGIKAARYYCGRECQVSDWKKKHKQEHAGGNLE